MKKRLSAIALLLILVLLSKVIKQAELNSEAILLSHVRILFVDSYNLLPHMRPFSFEKPDF